MLSKKITREDIVRALQSGKRYRAKELDILCDKVNAIRFRDLIEFYLYLSGVSNWQWTDAERKTVTRQSLPRVIWNLFRDMVCFPFILALYRLRIFSLSKETQRSPSFDQPSSILYLRTDHWFNLESGGSVGHTSGVINSFRALGHPTHVVSTDYLKGVERNEGFHLCPPEYGSLRNVPGMPTLLYNRDLTDFLEPAASAIKPSFIYQRYSLNNFSGVKLSRSLNVPFVLEYNGSEVWMARNWGKPLKNEALSLSIEMLNLKAADLIVVVSTPMKDELIERGIEERKILVNPNGVDPDVYSPDVDGSAIRAQYGLEGKTVVGFIGTFGKWHGAEVLAEAFGMLIREHPEYRDRARLLMIGDGTTMPQVRQNIERYGISDISTLTGIVPQTEGPAHLAACDVLVASHVPNPDGTPFFGSPTKLFEYMAMGKGIVASDLDQIGEVLDHGRTAWMVRPGDTADLMQGIKKIIDEKELRDELGANARREAIEKHTWKEHTRKIVEKLEALMGEG